LAKTSKKTYKFAARVALHDPEADTPTIHDYHGVVIMHATRGKRYVEAGEPVDLDTVEGERILAIVGAYK
jgi:hypothetical protein